MCNRWYYRCLDCLSVCAAEVEVRETARCGLCAGSMECMGKVEGNRLAKSETLCACDDRCTSAKGPRCDCKCQGENHGTGRVVEVSRDMGPVPVLRVVESSKARAVAEEWRAALGAARAEYQSLTERKRGGWLSGSEYDRWCTLYRTMRKAREARSHAGRMRTLGAAVAAPVSLFAA